MQRQIKSVYGWCRDVLPFTLHGLVLLGIAIWSFRYFAIELNDFFVRSAVFVFMMVMGFLFISTILVRWMVRRQLERLSLSPSLVKSVRDVPLTVVNEGGNFQWWPLIEVNVESQNPERYRVISTSDPKTDRLLIQPTRRGKIEHLSLRFWVGDIFGFFKTAIHHDVDCSLSILPPLPQLETSQLKLPNEGDQTAHPAGALAGDYVDMRRYAPGDPQRFILWKAYARSRKLLIRTPERAESTEPAIALILLTCFQDQAAADVTRYFLEDNANNMAFGACGLDALAFDRQSALLLLQTSGQVESPSIDTVCAAMGPVLEQSGGRMVIVASPSDPDLGNRLNTLETRLGVQPYVLLASTATESRAPSRLSRWGLIRSPEGAAAGKSLHDTVERLKEQSRHFEVINPQTGRRWAQEDWR